MRVRGGRGTGACRMPGVAGTPFGTPFGTPRHGGSGELLGAGGKNFIPLLLQLMSSSRSRDLLLPEVAIKCWHWPGPHKQVPDHRPHRPPAHSPRPQHREQSCAPSEPAGRTTHLNMARSTAMPGSLLLFAALAGECAAARVHHHESPACSDGSGCGAGVVKQHPKTTDRQSEALLLRGWARSRPDAGPNLTPRCPDVSPVQLPITP
jgi:hypothetical protein